MTRDREAASHFRLPADLGPHQLPLPATCVFQHKLFSCRIVVIFGLVDGRITPLKPHTFRTQSLRLRRPPRLAGPSCSCNVDRLLSQY